MKILVTAKTQAFSFDCEPGEKILHAGLRSGIALPYECGTGTCGTCQARLVRGAVHDAWPEAPARAAFKPDSGQFLMCQCQAGEDCDLEVSAVVRPMPPETGRPGALSARLRRRALLTHDVASLELELERPLDFEAGQFVLMTVPGIAGARAYSMVNFDPQAERLVLLVKKKPDGRMSEWLVGDTAPGTRVGLFGPMGGATFHPDVAKNLLLIAGGSGIAGMMSILSRAAQDRYFERHSGHLVFGVRTRRDLFFLDELAAFQAGSPRLEITIAGSDEELDPELAARYPRFAFAKGLVHAVAGERMTDRFENIRAYAAGPPPMVDATLRMLVVQGRLSRDNIRYDKFS